MISIYGIGWINQSCAGCARLKENTEMNPGFDPHLIARNRSIFKKPVKNSGRFNNTSILSLCACSLALKDIGGISENCATGIVGTNSNGCLEANMRFFSDYVQCGRTMARGNLFIYTLPTSPLAETAIYLGIKGPLFYVSSGAKRLSLCINTAADTIAESQANAMLAVDADEKGALAFLLGREENVTVDPLFSLAEALSLSDGFTDSVKDRLPAPFMKS